MSSNDSTSFNYEANASRSTRQGGDPFHLSDQYSAQTRVNPLLLGHSAPPQYPTSSQNPAGAQSLPPTSGSRPTGSTVSGFVINGPGLQLPPQGVHDSNRPPPPPPIAPRERKPTSNVGGTAARPTASVPPRSSVENPVEFQPQTAGSQHARAGNAPTQRLSNGRSHLHGAQRNVPRPISSAGTLSAHPLPPPTAPSAAPRIPNRIPQPRVSSFAAGGQVYQLYHHNPPVDSLRDHSRLPLPSHALIAPPIPHNHVHGNGPHAPETSAHTMVYRAPSQVGTHAQQTGDRYIECILCHSRFPDGHKVPAAEHVLTKHIKPVFGNLILIAKTHLSKTDPARSDTQAPQPHAGERYCTFLGCGAHFAELDWVTVRHVIASHLKPEYLGVLQEASAYLGLFNADGARI